MSTSSHKLFKPDKNDLVCLVHRRHSNTHLVVGLLNGNLGKFTNDNFPIGATCYIDKNDKNKAVCDLLSRHYKTTLLYDANRAMYSAIYVHKAKLQKYRSISISCGELSGTLSGVIYTPLGRDPNRLPAPAEVQLSLGDYVSLHCDKNGLLSCWLIPGIEDHWDIIACVDAGTFVDFTRFRPIAEEDTKKLQSGQNKDGPHLGIVIFPGKMVVDGDLVDCPKNLSLGSTHMCTYTIVKVSPTQVFRHLLTHKPVKLRGATFDTFVDRDGCVMIKTIVGRCFVPVKELPSQINPVSAKTNYAKSVYFPGERIKISNKFAWSTDAIQVIIGFHLYWYRNNDSPPFDTIQGSVRRVLCEPHIVAFFDDAGVWRMPEVIPEMNVYVDALKKMDIPLKPGTIETTKRLKIPARGYPFQLFALDSSLAKVLELNPEEERQSGPGTQSHTAYSFYQSRPEIPKRNFVPKPYVKQDVPNEKLHDDNEDEFENVF